MIIQLLFKKRFPINRPITDLEHKYQLDPKQRTDVEPMDCLATIALNSTYLECTDYFCTWRGLGIVVGSVITIGLFLTLKALIELDINHSRKIIADLGAPLFYSLHLLLPLFLLVLACGIELFLFEVCRKTHYPIRLNRKNRMIYEYRRNNTIMSVPWDEAFFHLGPDGGTPPIWDVRAHVMDKDGITVRETILFGYWATNQKAALQFWEYLRRYMEEGPKDAYEKTLYCLPINDRREPFHVGLFRLLMNFKGVILAQILFFPVLFIFAIGRSIAAYTSRIPVWPKEVEDACAIESGDPYVRTWRMNPSWFALTQK